MRFLLTTYEYPQFMRWMQQKHDRLADCSYAQQLRLRLAQGFLWADFYSRNLRSAGHEAEEVVPENPQLQFAWAKEHGHRTGGRWRVRLRRGVVPWLYYQEDTGWVERILMAQVRSYRPDVLFVRDIGVLSARFLREAREHVRLVVGQHASRFDKARDYSGYDLMLSSLPNFVTYFRERGLRAEPLRLGFDPAVLASLAQRDKSVDVSLVGKLGGDHVTRATFVENLVATTGIRLWGTTDEGLSEAARARFVGPAWGIDMYQVLRDSRMTVNQHEFWAEDHANNLRLYEATGVGTLLLTDAKSDLATLFEPHREVAVYRSTQECQELVDHYLAHPQERDAIAAAGLRRTLHEHTYAHRMEELLVILKRYI